MLDGHVKTLHPNIHGGILARRDQKHHMEALNEHGIGTFDVLVVNLYPFYEKVSLGGIEFEDEIETQAQDSDEPVKQSREGCDAQQPKFTIYWRYENDCWMQDSKEEKWWSITTSWIYWEKTTTLCWKGA